MKSPSNLPPGVTDRMIEEQQGCIDLWHETAISPMPCPACGENPDDELERPTCLRCGHEQQPEEYETQCALNTPHDYGAEVKR